MKSMYLLVSLGILLSSGIASAASTLVQDDLFVYYDFKATNGQSGVYARLTPVIAPQGSQFNPCLNNGNIHSATGGYGGGGYIGNTTGSFYSPSCENLQGGNLNYASQGMSFSLKFCDVGTAGISICSYFSGGNGDDAAFLLSGTNLNTPGFGNWTMADGRNSVISHTGASITDISSLGSSIPWQSLVVSIATNGIMSIYLDGSLYATSNSAWNRTGGNLQSVRFGANGRNSSAQSDGLYSDFAIWDKALTAEDAAWLATHSTSSVLVPEPTTATLALLGMATLLVRRRRR